ncbi:MAG TPA: hypothetical protein VMT30_08420 [Candidatus Saccharimonadia bacterium]|nr:hypothetical protein [Candidatus Saccharimonadia bacterium]
MLRTRSRIAPAVLALAALASFAWLAAVPHPPANHDATIVIYYPTPAQADAVPAPRPPTTIDDDHVRYWAVIEWERSAGVSIAYLIGPVAPAPTTDKRPDGVEKILITAPRDSLIQVHVVPHRLPRGNSYASQCAVYLVTQLAPLEDNEKIPNMRAHDVTTPGKTGITCTLTATGV